MLITLILKAVGVCLLTAGCVLIEMLAPAREEVEMYERGRGAAFILLQNVFGVLLIVPLQQLYAALHISGIIVFPLADRLAPLGAWGMALGVVVMLLIGDFFKYWWHRADHAFFWPIHAVHHASTKLHVAQNFGHPFQALTMFAVIAIPMSLFQVNGPQIPLFVGIIMGASEALIHSPTKFHLGPFRRLIVDNRFHRIHHSIKPEHWNRNFGICFTIWDQLFGTSVFPRDDDWPEVGVRNLPPPRNSMEFLAYPAIVLRNRALRGALPPGDKSHDAV